MNDDRHTPFGAVLLRWALMPLALMPGWLLYRCSDVLAFLLRHVVRYRRRLIIDNLAVSFPEKSEAERRDILNGFYRNFADYIVESIKLLHISDEEMLQRFEFGNIGLLNDLLGQRRTVIAYFSHCFNWEWAPSVTLHFPESVRSGVAFCQIYRPLRNKIFDALMLHIRSRFGSLSIPKSRALRYFVDFSRKGIPSVTGFMSDQKPSHGDTGHILQFLNRPTDVITGTETLARRLDAAVIYWDMRKTSRGHYRIDIIPMAMHAAYTEPSQLTVSYYAMLENSIRRDPTIWLWSHNRWKNAPKPKQNPEPCQPAR